MPAHDSRSTLTAADCYGLVLLLRKLAPAAAGQVWRLAQAALPPDPMLDRLEGLVPPTPAWTGGPVAAWRELGLVLARTGMGDAEARIALETWLALTGGAGDTDVHTWLAKCHAGLGDDARALEYLERAYHADPGCEALAAPLMTFLHRVGRLDEAALFAGQVLERQPDDTAALLVLGDARLEQDEIAAALACYDRALTLQPDYRPALERRARIFDLQGQSDRAAADCAAVLAADPDHLRCRALLGNALAAQGHLAAAYGHWRAVSSRTADAFTVIREPAATPDPAPLLPDGRALPRISVVMPSFNQAAYVEQALASVLDQGYPNLQVIVIDGGSTDGTAAILERWRPRLDVLVIEPDRGQSDALNKGFAYADGEILTWLNTDDQLLPGALHTVALAFATSDADMVAGACRLLKGTRVIAEHITSCPEGPLPLDALTDAGSYWLRGMFFMQPEVFFRRTLWLRAGGRVEDSLYYSMDYDLWVRFARAGARLAVVGTALALFRLHPEQKTWGGAFTEELIATAAAHRAAAGLPPPEPPPPEPPPRRRIVLLNDVGFQWGAGRAHQMIADSLATAGHVVTGLALAQPTRRPDPGRVMAALEAEQPDLVILGNLHMVEIPLALVEQIAARWPTLFILHDEWVFTGRCTYVKECRRFVTGCDAACPTPWMHPWLHPSAIAAAWQTKHRLFGPGGAVAWLATSGWLADRAASALGIAAAGDPLPSRVLVHGLDLEVFRPRDRRAAREALGLPPDAFLIITVAVNWGAGRKGLDRLGALADALDDVPNLRIILPGLIRPQEEELAADPRFIRPGYLFDSFEMALYYAAADVLVGMATVEAFGLTLIEAAACGVPVVAFRVGGVPEAVADGVSGLLADPDDPCALAALIRRLRADDGLRRRLSFWSRIHVQARHSAATACRRLHAAFRAMGVEPGVKLTLAPTQRRALRPARVIDGDAPEWTTPDTWDLPD